MQVSKASAFHGEYSLRSRKPGQGKWLIKVDEKFSGVMRKSNTQGKWKEKESEKPRPPVQLGNKPG